MKSLGKGKCDVAVIGGGPAGISAGVELSKKSPLNIKVFENENVLGGIPRSAHVFFGMRDLKRFYTGKQYADKLSRLLSGTSVGIHLNSTVLEIRAGAPHEKHRIVVASMDGVKEYECTYILLAMGCFESSREKRLIPGTRPSGVFTTGTLQKMINLQKLKPGGKAVVIGSEHVAYSSVVTLRSAGISVEAVVEEGLETQTYGPVEKILGLLFGLKVFRATVVKEIYGNDRVEGVRLFNTSTREETSVECDTVVVTGKFTPESAILFGTPVQCDPMTNGPIVDMRYQTSVHNIFAAGNILRGADMHDLCALEGRRAARMILEKNGGRETSVQDSTTLSAAPPIRYVVPQRIQRRMVTVHRASKLSPSVSIQVPLTMKNAVVEAHSGSEKIWHKTYSKIIGSTTLPIPIEKFDWERVNMKKGIMLKLS